MDSFTVEGPPDRWSKMFEAAIPTDDEKLGKDLLGAAKKLVAAAIARTPVIDGVLNHEPTVRVQVLATDTGGFARFMLDVYVTP